MATNEEILNNFHKPFMLGLGDEDIPQTPKIQRLVHSENLIDVPSPEYETKIDFDAILQKVPKKEIAKNWRQILDSTKYDKTRWTISKTKIEQMRKLYVDKAHRMEILPGEEVDVEIKDEEKKALTRDELEELFKQEVVEMASSLLFEAGFGGTRKGELYSVIMDHIKQKLFDGKKISEVKTEELEGVLENLEEIRKTFSTPIIQGILGEKNANK